MVMVWITYLQLLLNGILRQRRSSLIISCSVSTDNTPTCFVSNMSEGRFHIQNVAGDIEIDGERFGGDITEPVANNHEQSFQRPLADGESLELGTFKDLLDRVVAAQHGDMTSDPLQKYGKIDFYITIVGIHGASRKAVAARRGFRLHLEDGSLKASGLLRHTQQYRWGPKRRRIVEQNQVIN